MTERQGWILIGLLAALLLSWVIRLDEIFKENWAVAEPVFWFLLIGVPVAVVIIYALWWSRERE